MKWLHHLLRGASLTAALFVFQACYGSPQIPMPEPEEMEVMDAVEVRSDVDGGEASGTEVAGEAAEETTENNG